MNAFRLCLPYAQSVKVSKRKEISPRIIKERGKLMKRKVRKSPAMTATSHSTDGRRHPGIIQNWTRRNVPTPTTTSVQVVKAVVHFHERVVEDSQMSLNVFHPLPMLVHELVETGFGRTTSREALIQSLEQLVRLVELNRMLERVEGKKEADVLDA